MSRRVPTEQVILDTDAFSFLLTNKPQAAAYPSVLRGKVPAVSFVTVAEVRYGALSAGWGHRRASELEDTLRKFLRLPYNDGLASLWARLKRDARQNGHPLGQPEHSNDLWVAACGAYYQAPILTGNVRHFSKLPGVRIIDGS
jgi:predicted nucleic acid-binding protein